MLRDAYGNTYTYGHLAKLATEYPVPRPGQGLARAAVAKELKAAQEGRGPRPPRPPPGTQVESAPQAAAEGHRAPPRS